MSRVSSLEQLVSVNQVEIPECCQRYSCRREAGFLGLVGLTSLSLLLINLRLHNPFPFFWSGYLIFPEEVIAELIALVQRRHTEKVPQWRIRLEIIYEVLLLLWAFQIVIRIDNIKLPPGGNRSAK